MPSSVFCLTVWFQRESFEALMTVNITGCSRSMVLVENIMETDI
jgi:hypothetical protein